MWPSLLAATLIAVAPEYGALAADATEIRNLGRFLESYLEDCAPKDAPAFDRAACAKRVELFRREHAGRRLRIDVSGLDERLQFAGWDDRKKAYRLLLTPMFGERGLGLSVGKPTKTTRDGLPIVKVVPIWVERPDGEPELIFKKRLQRGMVRLELLVEAERAWSLSRKGDTDLRGLSVELIGLRLKEGRGARVLAEQTYRR